MTDDPKRPPESALPPAAASGSSGNDPDDRRLGRGRGRGGKKRRNRDRRGGGPQGPRLRSARESMGLESEPPAPEEVLGQREFPVQGTPWVAWAAGSGRMGLPGDPLAHVTEVYFSRAADPARPVRSLLCSIPDLADLPNETLLDLWARARPYRPPRDRLRSSEGPED